MPQGVACIHAVLSIIQGVLWDMQTHMNTKNHKPQLESQQRKKPLDSLFGILKKESSLEEMEPVGVSIRERVKIIVVMQ